MKVLKCPECGDISTFTHQWWTSTNYIAPVEIDEYGDIDVNFDKGYCLDDESEYDEGNADTTCDKCGAIVEIDSIEAVEIGEEVSAA